MSKEISRKQLEIYELSMDDGAKAIFLDESMPIVIGYDEADIRKILQLVFLPDEQTIKDNDALSNEEIITLLREAANVAEEKLRNERLGMNLLELVRSGETLFRLEILPDAPTVEMLRVDITTDEIKQDAKDGFIIEWYMWDVVRKIELEDRTRVIVHVP